MGFNQSAIVRWVKRAPEDRRARIIPTCSSRPHHHPEELPNEVIEAIIKYRLKYNRCAEVVHHLLARDNIAVSLSSVKRTLNRQGLIKRSPWKRWHKSLPRPEAVKPGILVQIDTVHLGEALKDRLYVYTLIDVFSRWTYARVSERINTYRSLNFVKKAQKLFPLSFQTLQSDHGQEFSTWFTEHIQKKGLIHRHSRVRMPSDNGHLERFNRTIQDECLRRVPRTLRSYRKAIPEYIHYYNTERPHLALDMRTPQEVMRSY